MCCQLLTAAGSCVNFSCATACWIIGVLIGAIVVFMFGGAFGTYWVMFAHVNSGNGTSAMDTAISIVEQAYEVRRAPESFVVWGVVFVSVYAVFALLFLTAKFCSFANARNRAAHEAFLSPTSSAKRL